MAPDAIYDYALLETSRWQREAMSRKIDTSLDDTLFSCYSEKHSLLKYLKGVERPHYSVPSLIGEILYLKTGAIFEIHVKDVDSRYNLRLWCGVSSFSGKLYDDREFHNSPNRR